MSDTIRTEIRDRMTVHVCNDCSAWSHEGQALRHSKRCDTPLAQPKRLDAPTTKSERRAQRTARELAAAGKSGVGLTPDEAFVAWQRGQISMSDAMNRDD